MWRPLLTTGFCLALLIPFTVLSQEPEAPPPGDSTGQAASPSTGIPTFYAHSRQVIVEAEVWDKSTKKGEHPWIGNEPLTTSQKEDLQTLPPVARGLAPKDFHVFDNGVEQRINYFHEADFPAADTTNQWYFFPTAGGTWGGFQPLKSFEFPLASYLIGYVPPTTTPGICHAIRVFVTGREVHLNRDRYCALTPSGSDDIDAIAGKKLGQKMRAFASGSSRGSIPVSMRASTFWSSRILRLSMESSPTKSTPTHAAADFTYVVEVHDSKALATVQVAADFDVPEKTWYYPCSNGSAIYVLGTAYDGNSNSIVGQFASTFSCLRPTTWLMRASNDIGVLVPSQFYGQINLPPGDFNLRLVVSDGHEFGVARTPVHVSPLDPQRLMMSGIVVGGVVRGASSVLREAASITPDPVVPSPLISKGLQFCPDPETPARLRKRTPLFLYFELYEPMLHSHQSALYYHARIVNLKDNSWEMDTGSMSAADWMLPGSAVVPIGLKVDTEKLAKGPYRVEIQASDSAGRQTEWRQTTFDVN